VATQRTKSIGNPTEEVASPTSMEARAVMRAMGIALAVAVACVIVFQWEMSAEQLAGARSDLAQAQSAQERFSAALKFFELQSTMGVADYGQAPAGITPADADVARLASQLKTPEASFGWVTSKISYTQSSAMEGVPARAVLKNRIGNCQGKANLLASLMLAQGVRREDMRVIYGQVRKDGMPGAHAWLEVFQAGRWWVYDSTPYLQSGAGKYDRDQFYTQNSVVPVVVYNDQRVGFDLE
jgi:transglutaminase-like putative cysteine protease